MDATVHACAEQRQQERGGKDDAQDDNAAGQQQAHKDPERVRPILDWSSGAGASWKTSVTRCGFSAKNPAFTLATVGTLALAIGATTAIFSVVQGVLLQPLPYHEPERLVRVWEVSPQGEHRNVVSAGNYLDWRDRASAFESLGAHGGTFAIALTGAGEPLTVGAARVTPSAFDTLSVQAQAGRLFNEEEGRQGGPPAVLISDRLWRQRFGADRAVLGRPVTLNDEPFAVVGVMRAGFAFPSTDVDIWIAQQFSERDREQRRAHNFAVIARLKGDRTMEAARSEMRALARQIADEQPAFMTGWSVNVLPFHDDLVGNARPLILILFGVAMVVLLVACANLANLTLARATGRVHEIAMRSALGASRSRIAKQLLTESLVQSAIGGALGVGVVAMMLPTLIAAAPADIPRLHDIGLDRFVFIFATGVTVLSALIVGLVPALRGGWATLPHQALTASRLSGTPGAARLRGALLVAQVALALVLLVGAGLLVRSLIKLNAVDYGFAQDGLLALNLDIPAARYPDVGAQSRFYERLLERVRALPGVAAASTTSGAPASGIADDVQLCDRGEAGGDAQRPGGSCPAAGGHARLLPNARHPGPRRQDGRADRQAGRTARRGVQRIVGEAVLDRRRGRPPHQLRRSGGAVVRGRRRCRRHARRRPRSARALGDLRAVRTTARAVGMALLADAGRAGSSWFGADGSRAVDPLRSERDRSAPAAAVGQDRQRSLRRESPRAAGLRCS